MKKWLVSLIMICFVLILGNAQQASAQHFDYDEAYQIVSGKWVNVQYNNCTYYLAWKSYDGSECNIVNGKGYTDPTGNSLIYVDYKGRPVAIYVTYYPDQDKYYGKILNFNTVVNKWVVMCECAVRE
jgi:hypothetical protein